MVRHIQRIFQLSKAIASTYRGRPCGVQYSFASSDRKAYGPFRRIAKFWTFEHRASLSHTMFDPVCLYVFTKTLVYESALDVRLRTSLAMPDIGRQSKEIDQETFNPERHVHPSPQASG